MNQYFVYILRSVKDGSFYIGYSQNIEDRLWEHNIGRTGYSSKRRPWELIYKEEYASSTEALKREKYLKSLKSKKYIEKLVLLSGR